MAVAFNIIGKWSWARDQTKESENLFHSPLNAKRKTGRPALEKKALIRQPFVSILTADNEALDLTDDNDDDIKYDAHTDEVLNNNYVSYDNELNFRAFDCGID